MKVLMFGWEFPPHISGGLGTACHGLTKGLSKFPDIEVIFVVPRAFGDEDTSNAHIVGASDVYVSQKRISVRGFAQELSLIEVDSLLVPYAEPEEFYRLTRKFAGRSYRTLTDQNFEGKIPFTGGYGPNLFEEIRNYALVAAAI
ncbi:MAG TPA: glycogen/starch synthase, partial [Bacteroidales bacterium]|nr:glycogen/starch synthase [Bacteroidales bacterium]